MYFCNLLCNYMPVSERDICMLYNCTYIRAVQTMGRSFGMFPSTRYLDGKTRISGISWCRYRISDASLHHHHHHHRDSRTIYRVDSFLLVLLVRTITTSMMTSCTSLAYGMQARMHHGTWPSTWLKPSK